MLHALISDGEAYDKCADIVHADHFTGGLRVLAQTVLGLYRDKRSVDVITVQAELRARGKFSEALSVELSTALSAPGFAWNARDYATSLRDTANRRRVAEVADQLAKSTGSTTSRIEQAIKALQEIEITRADSRSFSDHYQTFHDNLKKEFHEPDKTAAIIHSGIAKLDRYLGGFRAGVLAVVAARPGVGKSSLLVTMAINMAKRGVPVGLFWLEDSARDFVKRAVAKELSIPGMRMRHGSYLDSEHIDTIHASKLKDLPIIIDDTHGLTPTEVALRMRLMHRRHGVRVVFADHLGEMRLDGEERWGDRHDLALGRAAKLFRDTAKDLGIAPVLAVQLNRQVESRAGGTLKLSDLADSGQIEQAARLVAMCHRPKPLAFHIEIVKNTDGPTGTAECVYSPDTMAVHND